MKGKVYEKFMPRTKTQRHEDYDQKGNRKYLLKIFADL